MTPSRSSRPTAPRPVRSSSASRRALSRVVADALKFLGAVRNYSPHTLDNYQRAFDKFAHYLDAQGLGDEVRHFNDRTVLAFITDAAGKGDSPSTLLIRLTALSSVAQVLMKLRD